MQLLARVYDASITIYYAMVIAVDLYYSVADRNRDLMLVFVSIKNCLKTINRNLMR